ncbi:MAG TPA: alpha/beta hydrolase [Chitinophagales bacterium]|nr:alpha/beta hydrolase [Chitinophagales bacterium]
MTWKMKLVLLFARIRKPLDPAEGVNIATLRRVSERASRLGTRLFDKHVEVAKVTNTVANGVPVRIYQSNTGATGQEVIIYYHGGGFVLYGLEAHDNVCRRICAMRNCIVVSVDYRKAPEYIYPAAHDDAFAALQWVRTNIAEYGGNAADILVMGDSAGGNLSACMAHRCKKAGIKLKAQVLIYPWIDGRLSNPSIDRNGEGYLLTKPTMLWFQQQYTPHKEDQCVPEISPCFETDFKGLAPAFILTAQYDPLLDDGFNYYNQLKNEGVNVEYKEYPELIHGFFNLPGADPNAIQAYHDIDNFLNSL